MNAYVKRLLVVCGTLTALFSLYVAFIDPFGIYRHRGFPNAGYPALTWSRVAAAERLTAKCDVAFVGSSRVVFGYGTREPRMGRRLTCNGALGGTSMMEIGSVWDLIANDTDISTVLLFVDLHMFNDLRGTNHDFLQSRFNPERTTLTYHLWALTSFQSFEMATKTIGFQLPIFKPITPLRTSSMETRGMMKTTLLQPDMYRRFEPPKDSVATLRRILADAERRRIQVMVIIPAVHAMELETTWTAGMWEANKAWKRMLVAETSRRKVPLWDFATYHSPALAVLPTNIQEAPNPWWADMSHQSQLLGKLTMERIMDAFVGKSDGWEPGFGVALTPENIEEQLSLLDEGRDRWHEAHPEQVAWFQKVVANILETDPAAATDWERNRRRYAGEVVEPAPPTAPLPVEDEEGMEF